MDFKELINLAKTKKKNIAIITSIFLLLALVITFAQPLKYRATTRLLVVQEGSAGSDVYSISRSNKYLSSILSEVVYSNSFFEQVLSSNYNIDPTIFSLDSNKRMKQWKKMVSSTAVNDTGIIVIDTYHPDRYQANQINQAIAYTLKTKNGDYHGLENKVSVKVIDRTILSNWPVKPNIILNLFFGIFFGVLASFGFVKIYPNKEIKILPSNIFSRKKKHVYEDMGNGNEEADVKSFLEENNLLAKKLEVEPTVLSKEEVVEEDYNRFSEEKNDNADEYEKLNGNINNVF